MMSHFVEWFFGWLSWLWVIIILAAVFVELAWLYFVVVRAYDREYDPEQCRQDRGPLGTVDLRKALRRRTSWPLLGFPMYIVFAVLLITFVLNASGAMYLSIATLWFLMAPLRKMWGIAVARRVVRNRGKELTTTYWLDVKQYYVWGLTFPKNVRPEPWFVGRLMWLNKFQSVWYVFQLFRVWGVLVQALAALAWPIASLAAIFYHMEMVDDYDDYYRPWWRFDPSTDKRPVKA